MASKQMYPENCNLGVGAQRKPGDLKVIGVAKAGQGFRDGCVAYRQRRQHDITDNSGLNYQVEVSLGKRPRKSFEAEDHISEAKNNMKEGEVP